MNQESSSKAKVKNPTTGEYFALARQHIFAAETLVKDLQSGPLGPYTVDANKKDMLVRSIGLLMGLSIELMLKGCVSRHDPEVSHTHEFKRLLKLKGGKEFAQVLELQAVTEAKFLLLDERMPKKMRISQEEAPKLVTDYIRCIGLLHSKGGNLYRYGGDGMKTPAAPFLVQVLSSLSNRFVGNSNYGRDPD